MFSELTTRLNLIGRKEGIQRLVKNKWYERSHWTYKVNRGSFWPPFFSSETPRGLLGNVWKFPIRIFPAEISTNEMLQSLF
jgi:hypothetical protein